MSARKCQICDGVIEGRHLDGRHMNAAECIAHLRADLAEARAAAAPPEGAALAEAREALRHASWALSELEKPSQSQAALDYVSALDALPHAPLSAAASMAAWAGVAAGTSQRCARVIHDAAVACARLWLATQVRP